MACMSHFCFTCGDMTFDNAIRYQCDKCGGRISNDFDEKPEREMDRDEEGDQDDDRD